MRWLWVCLLGCAMVDGADVTRNRPGGDPNHNPMLPDGGGDLRGAGSDGGSGSMDLGATDLSGDFASSVDLAGAIDLASAADLAGTLDLTPVSDLARAADLTSAGGGVLTGGPCASGAIGATAIRARWVNGGGHATPQIEAFGMPDSSREKVSAFGFSIGFTPVFDDNFLGPGGLVLDGSDFIDIELSTVGVSVIRSGTLALFGRSFNTTASGSFNWQTFVGTGATPSDFVSNSVPYQWYAADLEGAIGAGDGMVLLRVKAGPSSGSLIVNRIEVCLDAG